MPLSPDKGSHKMVKNKTLEELIAIGFGNMDDFARFEPNGRVHIFDWDKARQVGAQVSVVTRKMGRGKNAREVRITQIKMPDKFPALMKLLRLVDPPQKHK